MTERGLLNQAPGFFTQPLNDFEMMTWQAPFGIFELVSTNGSVDKAVCDIGWKPSLSFVCCLSPVACCFLHNACCLLHTPIAYCLVSIACCLLPIAYCLLLIAYCLVSVANCLLPTAYFLLSVAYCLLSVAC